MAFKSPKKTPPPLKQVESIIENTRRPYEGSSYERSNFNNPGHGLPIIKRIDKKGKN